jgi:phage gpG-like protein
MSQNNSQFVEGDAQFNRALEGLYDSLKDFRRAWPQVAERYYLVIRRQFDSEGGRANPWAELAPSTLAGKAINYPGQPILRASNALFQSMVNAFDQNAVFRMTEDSLTLGTTLDYAAYHQKGTSKMPARPIFDFLDEDYKDFRDAARDAFGKTAIDLGFEVYA